MQTKYFRINKKEYCHINDDVVFIFNSKEPTRIPLEHDLGNGWGVMNVLNYIVFGILLLYTFVAVNKYGIKFFTSPINYASLFLLFLSLTKIKNAQLSSKTPTIKRDKIKSVHFKTPMFSYPRLLIYFDGPEGKILRRTIPVLYKQEALKVLEEAKLI